jgi:phosphotriesterase-related protein
LHHDRYYHNDDPLEKTSAEELAELFLTDINVGMENTSAKAGAIKVVTSGVKIKDREYRLFEAAAIAHQKSGAPILSHCEHGTGAIEQIKLFQELRIDLNRVTLSHTDKEFDLKYHQEILSTGINVEYDQSLRQFEDSNPKSAQLTLEMVNQGFISQIMMGTDGARRTLWRSLRGQPGLAWLQTGWRNRLLEVGLDANQLNQIFVINPAKTLTFASKTL